MTLEMFSGFIAGNIVGLVAVAVGLWVKRKQGRVQDDERTALIKAQSGATAFYLSLVVVYLAWIADNLMAYLKGDTIRLLSPLGIVLVVMLAIWGVAYVFHKQQFSAGGDMTEEERKKQLQTGVVLAGAGTAMGGLQATISEGNAPELHSLLLFLQGVVLVLAVKLIWGARKKANHG